MLTGQKRNKLTVLLIYIILALATIIAFEQVCHNEFVNYDDDAYVTENQHVKAGFTYDSIIWAFTTNRSSNWHPLTWLSHMLDCQLFGTEPCWHHLTNLLLHLTNTLLLFAVLRRMTGTLWRSVFVAAAFALHPLHVESVAWVAERKDVLSGLFWMLTMAAYARYAEQPGIGKYLLAVLAFGLGLMAKPMLVTLPFVLLLLDYWPLGRFQHDQAVKDANRWNSKSVDTRSRWRICYRLLWEKIPFFALSAVSSVITFLAQRSGHAVTTIERLPLKFRIVNAMTSYLVYIVKMFYPTRLAVFYPYPKTLRMGAVALLLVGISILLNRWAHRRPWLTVGLLWYLGTLVPVIGLVQVGSQAMADRYTYVPSIGIFIMVAWGAAELAAKWRYRKIVLGISAGVALAGLLLCTRMQVRHWKNSFTLYEHALAVTEGNFIAHYNLGVLLSKERRFDEAIMHYKEMLQMCPQNLEARNSMGVVFLEQGKYDEAIACFNEVLELKPDNSEAIHNLSIALKERQARRSHQETRKMMPQF